MTSYWGIQHLETAHQIFIVFCRRLRPNQSRPCLEGHHIATPSHPQISYSRDRYPSVQSSFHQNIRLMSFILARSHYLEMADSLVFPYRRLFSSHVGPILVGESDSELYSLFQKVFLSGLHCILCRGLGHRHLPERHHSSRISSFRKSSSYVTNPSS